MPPPDAAVAYYHSQKRITTAAGQHLQALWRQLDPANLDRSWTRGAIGDEAFVTVSLGQQAAADAADPYLEEVLAEQGIDTTAAPAVQARSFAGVAADGRSLETLLYEPVIRVKAAIGSGRPIADAMASGAASLDIIGRTQIADAGRTSVGVAIAARPEVTAWTRMLNPPSCSRCAVLAGKTFRWNQGFARHPLCDCRHIPTTEDAAGETTTDPRSYFDSLSAADQDKYFGADGAQAIRDGADIGQVVNVRRRASGLYQANGQLYTTEGTTKRGLAGKLAPGQARPAPETIYENADSRADAIEQLRTFGYLG